MFHYLTRLLLATCLTTAVWAQQTVDFPFFPNQPPLKIDLPEGYSLRSIEGIKEDVYIFCPWNEYFSIHPFRYKRERKTPVTDEAAMTVELEDFSKANPTIGFGKPKVWMTPQGPRGSMETSVGEKAEQIVGVYLFVPRGDELSVLTTMGAATSLNDQRLVHQIFLKAIK
ncbi:hypothetical protein JST97_17800 [bacterium]|nr:hypothetical protein [bacterium]